MKFIISRYSCRAKGLVLLRDYAVGDLAQREQSRRKRSCDDMASTALLRNAWELKSVGGLVFTSQFSGHLLILKYWRRPIYSLGSTPYGKPLQILQKVWPAYIGMTLD
ncbi:hypothetical protein BVC80_9019g34 [Macleaya cordata]|uniref:Uncharacterized protein n=1 Tax=Macleaya cordata TaxID=56857 RepID=A0A200QQK3_MACCD|nr:hypothetical protein BVC80_9019g34 [Macleaya cordata]